MKADLVKQSHLNPAFILGSSAKRSFQPYLPMLPANRLKKIAACKQNDRCIIEFQRENIRPMTVMVGSLAGNWKKENYKQIVMFIQRDNLNSDC